MSKRDPATRPTRAIPHPAKAGGRFEVHLEATNGRRKRRFGDPKYTGAGGRGTKDWPQLRAHLGAQRGTTRIAGTDRGAPRRPAILFLYEDLADLAELEPEQVFGMYPKSFIPKILPWLRCARRRLVHVCSGGLPPGEGIRVELVEETLWGLCAAALVTSLVLLWPRCRRELRPALATATVLGVAYVAYMFQVDVPMYWARWMTDAGSPANRPASIP